MPTANVVLVTGGARRIGAAICRHLHQNGFNILIHYNHSEHAAKELSEALNNIRSGSCHIFKADLNDLTKISALADWSKNVWGQVHALVNNASSFYPSPLSDANEEMWNDLVNTNLKAPFFLAQSLQHSLAQNNGCIVNIADIFADRPMPKHSIYSIAKAGNRMLTQALALELAPEVRVNSIAPGAILWPEDHNGTEIENPTKLEKIPLKRLGGTDAIAQAVLFFIMYSPYTTGQILRIDGGRSLVS